METIRVGVPGAVQFVLEFTDERPSRAPLWEIISAAPLKLRALRDTAARWSNGSVRAIPAGKVVDVFEIRADAWVLFRGPAGQDLLIEPPLLVARP
mgnify:CR=1 FL=1